MADMSTADINDLPDSAFAYIAPGGKKDASGKTAPRDLRYLPVHDAAHAKNALARLPQADIPAAAKAEAKTKILAACKKFGIDTSESSSSARQLDPAFQLLKRRRGSMVRRAERRGMALEMRAKPNGTGGTDFLFSGYGSVFDAPFDMWDPWGEPYVEVVRSGAFNESLARPDLDVPFLIGHNDAGIPLARTKNGTLTLAQDTHGLLVEARMDGARSDVRNLASAVDRGDMDEMSIGFVTMAQAWSPDYAERSMLSLDIHRGDVSSVALAASPATAGSAMIPVSEALKARARGEQRAPTQPYSEHDGETNECPQCHSVNDNAAAYCDQCGTAMKPVGPPNMPGVEDMIQACPCGQWNSADAKFCGQCGSPLTGPAPGAGGWYRAGRPGETRAADEIVDMSGAPDYNPVPHQFDPAAIPCTASDDCAAKGVKNSPDAKFCDQCGSPVPAESYSGNGTEVVDDSGVVEDIEGSAMSDAELLSHRRRELEFLALAR